MRNPSQIRTVSGVDIDPFIPHPQEILAQDIAHALSLVCRGNGHLGHFYSVAQHCLNCESEAAARGYSLRTRLFCLLHDATECYLSDVTRPVKQHFPLYYEAEKRLAEVIYRRFCGDLPTEQELAQVSSVDDALLYQEFLALCGVRMFDDPAPYAVQASLDFDFVDFAAVRDRFLERLTALRRALLLEE